MAEKKPPEKAQQIALRFNPELVKGIDKAVKESPIEFTTRQDFVRIAVTEELRRRGIIKTFK